MIEPQNCLLLAMIETSYWMRKSHTETNIVLSITQIDCNNMSGIIEN